MGILDGVLRSPYPISPPCNSFINLFPCRQIYSRNVWTSLEIKSPNKIINSLKLISVHCSNITCPNKLTEKLSRSCTIIPNWIRSKSQFISFCKLNELKGKTEPNGRKEVNGECKIQELVILPKIYVTVGNQRNAAFEAPREMSVVLSHQDQNPSGWS